MSIEHLDKLINKYPDNFIIIFFQFGSGGSSLYRILTSHRELYHSFKNANQVDYDDPIRYPDSIEGFCIQPDHKLSFKEQHIACAHVDLHVLHNPYNSFLEYIRIIKEGKTVVLRSHNFSLYEKFKNCRCIFIVENEPLDRFTISNKLGNPEYIPEEVYIVNISNLMSKNYDTFLEEYLKIVFELDLTPRINSVRSFILMWLERQERLKRSLS